MKLSLWKQKIDPAFPQFIKSFSNLLETWGLPATEGYINLDNSDPYFQQIEKKEFPSFEKFYEKLELDDLFREANKFIGNEEFPNRVKQILFNIENPADSDIEREIFQLTEKMQEESKAYYGKWTQIPDPEKKISEYIHFVSDIVSLQYHIYLLEDSEQDNNRIFDTAMIQRVIFTAWEVISLSIHKKSIYELYNEAKEGYDSALFKVIQLDKSLIDHDWARKRIRKAMYLGDRQFFASLAKAIKDDPLKHRKIKLERHLILMHFWYYGLYRLTIPELMQLLEESGIRIQEDEVTFRKFVDREIKPYYKEFKQL